MIFRVRAAVALLLLLVPVLAHAQESAQTYRSYADMTSMLKDLHSRYGDIIHLESIGKTLGGRDIWAVSLRKGNPAGPRAMLILAGVEPTQIAGSELALHTIEYFASNYGRTDSITRLLDAATIYVIPRVSPDATEALFGKVRQEQWRNGRPTDDDRDGSTDEDDVEDLNGDGMITLMRVKDPQGEWTAHPEDARVMKKASVTNNERGEFKLYSEGRDNDKDEKWNEDPPGGVHFNRNFTFNYEFFAEGSGVYQVSELETRAVADFVFSHPAIAVIVSFSPNENLMTPWKSDPRAPVGQDEERVVSSVAKEDEPYYEFIGKCFHEITGFSDPPKPQKGRGTFSEWAYYHAGRWSFSTFPWWPPDGKATRDSAGPDAKRAPGSRGAGRDAKAEDQDEESALMIRTLRWYGPERSAEVFVPWTRFDHPDFPGKEVEIGGFKPFMTHNPPADSLAATARSFNAFFTDVAGKLPSVSIRNTAVVALRAGVYRISADIANDGYFPTNTALGHRLRWVRDVAVTLELGKGQTLASGMASQVLGPIAGNGSFVTVSWVVLAAPGSAVMLTAESPTSGKSTQRIDVR